ncbi:MAG: hypothetical protein AB1505_27045 [Candidatus Latescibacterota bacterium]
MSGRGVALAARVRAETAELEALVARVERLREKAARRQDPDYYDGVALNLHGFYVGVERVLQMVVRDLDEAVPEGPDWRRELLAQCSVELTGVRPAVIARATRAALDEYRAFRHVVRNVYAFSLRPDRLASLAAGLRPCYDLLAADLATFTRFLEALTPPPDPLAEA